MIRVTLMNNISIERSFDVINREDDLEKRYRYMLKAEFVEEHLKHAKFEIRYLLKDNDYFSNILEITYVEPEQYLFEAFSINYIKSELITDKVSMIYINERKDKPFFAVKDFYENIRDKDGFEKAVELINSFLKHIVLYFDIRAILNLTYHIYT
jgi:hypothetical protein